MNQTQKNEARQTKSTDLVCRYCSMAITSAAFARDKEFYCCEGCFLKEKEFNAVKSERDSAYLAIVEALATALDIREHETGLHSKRVACHTLVLARHFTADSAKLRQIYWGSFLHDIGKIGVSDAVLLKKGPLTEKEWREMQKHPESGHSILSAAPFMDEAAEIVLCHEERYDGSGYPNGLAGGDIPFGARIFAVIDTLDAMISDRPYRKGLSFDLAKNEILSMAGSQFDPIAVDAFIAEERAIREMVHLNYGTASLEDLGIGRLKQ